MNLIKKYEKGICNGIKEIQQTSYSSLLVSFNCDNDNIELIDDLNRVSSNHRIHIEKISRLMSNFECGLFADENICEFLILIRDSMMLNHLNMNILINKIENQGAKQNEKK
ncbi:MAG: hypothetical protein R3Y05_05815 [bacterium]